MRFKKMKNTKISGNYFLDFTPVEMKQSVRNAPRTVTKERFH